MKKVFFIILGPPQTHISFGVSKSVIATCFHVHGENELHLSHKVGKMLRNFSTTVQSIKP